MKVGYLGPAGTYCQQAAEKLASGTSVEWIPLSPITSVFSSLRNGTLDRAVVPLENSIAGLYIETVAELARGGVVELERFTLPISLSMGVHPDSSAESIAEVRSKDTAIAECSVYLGATFPRAAVVDVDSTATAMESIVRGGLMHVAAIGSERGLAHYGLKVISRDIGNPSENSTVFLLLAKQS